MLATISSWPCVVAVAALLLNDLVLKQAFPGVVTGKLSDFAGIALVALLLLSAFPLRPLLVYVCISIAFAWWKSPFSSPFLAWLNGLGLGQFGRTVDYTDLLALSLLPLCRYRPSATGAFLAWKRIRTIAALPVCVITFLAVLGTSRMPARQDDFLIRDTSARPFERDAVASVIRRVAEGHGMSCQNCDSPTSVYFQSDILQMQYEFTGSNSATFTMWIQTSCALILWFCSSTSGEKKAEALRTSLKQELAARFKDFEYVERLRSDRW
jgi:hypothetical protein